MSRLREEPDSEEGSSPDEGVLEKGSGHGGIGPPMMPALFRPKKKWRLASQFDPLDYLEGSTDSTTVWRRNYSTLQPLEQQVLDVMHDQATRGQVLVPV